MYWIVIAIILIVIIYFWFFKKQGKLDFWKTAQKYADEAYDWFGSEDCWVIFLEKPEDGYHENLPEGEWDGPFYHRVPKLGKLITVFVEYLIIMNPKNAFWKNSISRILAITTAVSPLYPNWVEVERYEKKNLIYFFNSIIVDDIISL